MTALLNVHYHNPSSEMALLLTLGYAILDNQNLHIRLNIPEKSKKVPTKVRKVFQLSSKK